MLMLNQRPTISQDYRLQNPVFFPPRWIIGSQWSTLKFEIPQIFHRKLSRFSPRFFVAQHFSLPGERDGFGMDGSAKSTGMDPGVLWPGCVESSWFRLVKKAMETMPWNQLPYGIRGAIWSQGCMFLLEELKNLTVGLMRRWTKIKDTKGMIKKWWIVGASLSGF